jgi:hemerythrin-like domain-containing protein
MGIQIGAKPDSGFNDPLGMLHDCHRRIEQFLRVLGLVLESAAGRSLTAEETNAIQASLHYFRTGGPRHTADEEESLFPRLRSSTAAGALAELDRLEADHHRAQQLHGDIDELFTAWIEEGRLASDDEQRLAAANRELAALYAAHIDMEEKVVFPHAAQALDADAIAAMGQEFRQRRD